MEKRKTIHILGYGPSSNINIKYLCKVEPPEAAIFIKNSRCGKLIVSKMEYNRIARTVTPGITVVYPELIGSTWEKGPGDWIKKCTDQKELTLSADFPVGIVEKLRAAGFSLHISEKSCCPQREVKSEQEIRAIKMSQQASVTAMKAARQQIAAAEIGTDGVLSIGNKVLTAQMVRATIGHTLLDHECIAFETIVACGVQSADPHERGWGPLRAGQPIVIDIFPRSAKTGYWGDITRTFCRGSASPELKKIYNAVKAAQAMALKKVKAGAWTDSVHRAAADELIRRGFTTETVDGVPQGFIHGTGHGVGLEIHEAPRISAATHQKLKKGQIITIEPGLYYSQLGGIRIEDTVAVTQTGFTMLAPCPKQFEI